MERMISSRAMIQVSGVGAREGVPPRFFTGSVPGIGIGVVPPVAVVLTFRDRLLLNQDAKGPAFKCAIG